MKNQKLFAVGDKSKAICETCKDVVTTTFAIRDVPFSDGVGIAKDILVSVCDCCGEIVATPAQSTPDIKKARAAALGELANKASLTPNPLLA